MAELAALDLKRRNADREFLAAIHGVKLQGGGNHTRRHTIAETAHERMKRRRGIH